MNNIFKKNFRLVLTVELTAVHRTANDMQQLLMLYAIILDFRQISAIQNNSDTKVTGRKSQTS